MCKELTGRHERTKTCDGIGNGIRGAIAVRYAQTETFHCEKGRPEDELTAIIIERERIGHDAPVGLHSGDVHPMIGELPYLQLVSLCGVPREDIPVQLHDIPSVLVIIWPEEGMRLIMLPYGDVADMVLHIIDTPGSLESPVDDVFIGPDHPNDRIVARMGFVGESHGRRRIMRVRKVHHIRYDVGVCVCTIGPQRNIHALLSVRVYLNRCVTADLGQGIFHIFHGADYVIFSACILQSLLEFSLEGTLRATICLNLEPHESTVDHQYDIRDARGRVGAFAHTHIENPVRLQIFPEFTFEFTLRCPHEGHQGFDM